MPDILIKNESGVDEIWPNVNTVRFFDKEGNLVSFRYGGESGEKDPGIGIPPGGKCRVKFLDFDGNIYQSLLLDKGDDAFYPEKDPVKEGYVFAGWNYLEVDMEQVRTDIIVGSMWRIAGYSEQDNVFRVRLRTGDLTTGVRWYGSGSNTFEVDWGDGSAVETKTVSGNGSISHAYEGPGDYTICFRKTAGTGTYWFGYSSNGSSSSYACCTNTRTLIEAQIASDVKYIYSAAFSCCYTMKKVHLPDSITVINPYAFYYCYNLESIVVPTQVTSIGYNAFYVCYSLQRVSIPKKCSSFGNEAFRGCYALREVAFPDGTTAIPTSMFYECLSLLYVYLPDTIISIGNTAFQNCYCLTEISEIVNVKSIGSSAFSNCNVLRDVVTSDNLTTIGSSAFSGCRNFKKAKIPAGLVVINNSVYSGCNSIQEVEFPVDCALNIIYDNAFSGCYALKNIVLPEGVTSIGTYSFQNCYALQEITLPATLATMNTYPFYYCRSVTDLYLYQTAVPSLSNNPLYDSSYTALRIHVRAELIDAYKVAPYWSSYANCFVGDL